MNTVRTISTFLLLASFALIGCNGDDDTNPTEAPEAVLVQNLHAPGDVINRTTGQVTQVNPFVLFSFEDNQLVPAVGGNWDVGFKGTNIIVNSGVSGSGRARGGLLNGIFDELNELPSSLVLREDTQAALAIPNVSGEGWYNYNSANFTVSPIPGRILVFQTNNGKYVKMEILSYYRDAPPMEQVNAFTTPSAYYTFRYVLQPNGTRRFR